MNKYAHVVFFRRKSMVDREFSHDPCAMGDYPDNDKNKNK
jgi:hypothetical protein